MEYLIANPWIMWLAVGVVFLIVELLTTALVSIWFVPSAIITCLLSFVVDNLLIQIAIFVALSAVFMVVCRKIYNKHIKKPVDDVDQNEKLIGKTAKVAEDTNGISGRILVGDVLESSKEKVKYASPVPGGVGPLTNLELLENLIKSYEMREK